MDKVLKVIKVCVPIAIKVVTVVIKTRKGR